MRAASVSVAALLLVTAVLALGAVATLASALSTDPRSVGTLAVLTGTVLAAVVLGIRTVERPRTPYW